MRAQRFNADGSRGGSGLLISGPHVWSETSPSLTTLAGGGYVVTWHGSRDGQKIGTFDAGQGFRLNALDNIVPLGGGGDLADLSHGGNDTVSGGAGDDFLYWGASFTNDDRADGGAGYDTVGLLGSYTIAFDANDLASIEKLAVYSSGNAQAPNGYSLTMHDANVAGGQHLMIVAQSLLATEALTFNGAAELNGSFNVRGGRGADSITGGANEDLIWGNLGADQLSGGLGKDIFEYNAAAESTRGVADVIRDFLKGDRISLVGIDADGNAANGDSKFTWLGDGAFTGRRGSSGPCSIARTARCGPSKRMLMGTRWRTF